MPADELPRPANAAAEERAALEVLFNARSVCVAELVKLFKLRSARVASVESTLTRMLYSSVAITFCLYFVTVYVAALNTQRLFELMRKSQVTLVYVLLTVTMRQFHYNLWDSFQTHCYCVCVSIQQTIARYDQPMMGMAMIHILAGYSHVALKGFQLHLVNCYRFHLYCLIQIRALRTQPALISVFAVVSQVI